MSFCYDVFDYNNLQEELKNKKQELFKIESAIKFHDGIVDEINKMQIGLNIVDLNSLSTKGYIPYVDREQAKNVSLFIMRFLGRSNKQKLLKIKQEIEEIKQKMQKIVDKYDETFSFCEVVGETYGNFKQIKHWQNNCLI